MLRDMLIRHATLRCRHLLCRHYYYYAWRCYATRAIFITLIILFSRARITLLAADCRFARCYAVTVAVTRCRRHDADIALR